MAWGAVEVGLRSKGAKFRGSSTDGRRQGLHGVLRSLAQEFHAAVNLVFGKQGRDMELDGALGQIQFVSNFLIGEAAEYTLKYFLFPAGELYSTLGAMSCFEKFLRFFGEPGYAIGGSLNHDEVVAGRLSANHAVHGKKAGGMVDR